jgi:hypothetical protein
LHLPYHLLQHSHQHTWYSALMFLNLLELDSFLKSRLSRHEHVNIPNHLFGLAMQYFSRT